jgi:hypothetical protein
VQRTGSGSGAGMFDFASGSRAVSASASSVSGSVSPKLGIGARAGEKGTLNEAWVITQAGLKFKCGRLLLHVCPKLHVANAPHCIDDPVERGRLTIRHPEDSSKRFRYDQRFRND